MAGGKAVKVLDVSHAFATGEGTVHALQDVSLDIRAGEFVSIVGPSGCGKSTLLMLMCGLMHPTRGAIEIDGVAVTRPEINVGIVFQNPLLLPWRNTVDNVLIQFEMRGLPTVGKVAHAREMLSSMGLQDFENSFPHELSGGMKQRVSICRSLIHEPPLLLMDEPFGALDAITRDQLTLDFQRIWGAGGKTVIFITHSITEAVFLSDRIVVMTPRPGRVDLTIDIDLPRPRRLGLRDEPRFSRYTRLLRERFLAHGVLRDLDEEGCKST